MSRGRVLVPGAVAAIALLASCYSFVPTNRSVFPVGTAVAFDLNDVGRVSLANQIGPEVMQLSGVLRDQTNIDYTISVESMTYLNGRTSQWSGEPVTVKQEFVKSTFEKKFSSGRTAAAVAAGAGLVGGALLANSLYASGDKNPGDTKPPPGGTTIRILRWAFRLP
ncbi:MAG TPA: hypothetical protein VGJ47_03875 [Gemmatimonadaceae bacterium]|jgi:hypothetical protein